jgi:hypothetical protein
LWQACRTVNRQRISSRTGLRSLSRVAGRLRFDLRDLHVGQRPLAYVPKKAFFGTAIRQALTNLILLVNLMRACFGMRTLPRCQRVMLTTSFGCTLMTSCLQRLPSCK